MGTNVPVPCDGAPAVHSGACPTQGGHPRRGARHDRSEGDARPVPSSLARPQDPIVRYTRNPVFRYDARAPLALPGQRRREWKHPGAVLAYRYVRAIGKGSVRRYKPSPAGHDLVA